MYGRIIIRVGKEQVSNACYFEDNFFGQAIFIFCQAVPFLKMAKVKIDQRPEKLKIASTFQYALLASLASLFSSMAIPFPYIKL